MKKLITLSLFMTALFGGYVNAQTGVRLGLKAGYSLATQYGITPADNIYTVESDGRNGFAGGAFLYIPITDKVGIQQEFLYAIKGSRQNVTIDVPVSVNTVSEYNIDYFEMPIVLKYKFVQFDRWGIYGNAGIGLSLLLAGDYSITTTINTGGPPIEQEESGDMKGLDTFDYSFVYGAGADFKLFNMDLFAEARMTIGWNTLAMPNSTGADPVPLRNQDYVFGIGIYF